MSKKLKNQMRMQSNNTRSQDLEPAFHDAGQFYWMKFEAGLKGINKFGFEIPNTLVQDIDNEEDWIMAEIKFKYLKTEII